jgi:hypothetical protein
MAITRQFDEEKRTVMLLYKGEPLTPEIRIDDAKQLLDVLSGVIERAYQKLRDAGVA